MAKAAVPERDAMQMKGHPLSIISVGRDPELLRQRARLISNRSDLLVRSLTPEEAEEAARSGESHLWIFCNTVELPKLAYLASSVRRYSAGSRLLLFKGSRRPGFEDSLFHWIVRADDGLESFLAAVSNFALAA